MSSPDVAIIGGGIVGAATAYYLSKAGKSAVVIEAAGIGSKASGLAYGGLVPVSGFGIPGPLTELANRSFELHQSLREELSQECAYRTRDTLNIAFSREEAELLATRADWVNANSGIEAAVLSPSELSAIESRLSSDVIGGTIYKGTEEVSALALTQSLVTASGADYVHDAVIRLEAKVDEVVLHLRNSEKLQFKNVVCANGPWVSDLLSTMQYELPVPPLKGEILRLKTEEPALQHSIGYAGNYVTTKLDGLTWAGTTETHSGFDESITTEGRNSILGNLQRVLPELKILEVARQTACLRPTTPDGLPILGRLEKHPNILIATGAGRKGILYGPAMGRIVTNLLLGNTCDIEIDLFNPHRFG